MTRRTAALFALPLAIAGLAACGPPEDDPLAVDGPTTISGSVGGFDFSDTVNVSVDLAMECPDRPDITISVDLPNDTPFEWDCNSPGSVGGGTVITISGSGDWELTFTGF